MLGLGIGLTAEQIAAMADAQNSPLFDETDRLVLKYAEVLTRDNRVDDELFNQLAARFPRDELIELCFTVATAALVNRVHATFRTDIDDSTTQAVGDAEYCPIGR